MLEKRKIWLLVLGLAIFGTAILWHDKNRPRVENLVRDAASHQLERPVAVDIDLQNQIDDWIFVCGSVTEEDGTELRIKTAGTETTYESDNFCALINAGNKNQLAEFDFGSTDMPAMDWLEQYALDPEILAVQDR